MDETIKMHLDAIGEHLKGKPNAFVFLMSSPKENPEKENDFLMTVSKNGEARHTAGLIFMYLENTPDVGEAFTEIITGTAEEELTNIQ